MGAGIADAVIGVRQRRLFRARRYRRSSFVAGLPVAALAIALVSQPGSATAQSWTGSARSAGLKVGGDYNGLAFRCLGNGRVELVFSGFPGRLQLGQAYTVAVSIDGLATLFRAKAVEDAGGGYALVDDASLSDMDGLIAALRKGRTVEVSGPNGRYLVPLKGSGKALESFRNGCR